MNELREWDPRQEPPAYRPLIAPVDKETEEELAWQSARFAVVLFVLVLFICGLGG